MDRLLGCVPQDDAKRQAGPELLPPAGSTRIASPELRGVTLAQLRALLAFVDERCAAGEWLGAEGGALRSDEVTFYDLERCVADMPFRRAARGSSIAEALAPRAQRPRWVVTHAWSLRVRSLLRGLEQHAAERALGEEAPYWIGALALGPHELSAPAPLRADGAVARALAGPFARALALDGCAGTVAVVDADGAALGRKWVLLELFVGLTEPAEGTPRLVDCYAVQDADDPHGPPSPTPGTRGGGFGGGGPPSPTPGARGGGFGGGGPPSPTPGTRGGGFGGGGPPSPTPGARGGGFGGGGGPPSPTPGARGGGFGGGTARSTGGGTARRSRRSRRPPAVVGLTDGPAEIDAARNTRNRGVRAEQAAREAAFPGAVLRAAQRAELASARATRDADGAAIDGAAAHGAAEGVLPQLDSTVRAHFSARELGLCMVDGPVRELRGLAAELRASALRRVLVHPPPRAEAQQHGGGIAPLIAARYLAEGLPESAAEIEISGVDAGVLQGVGRVLRHGRVRALSLTRLKLRKSDIELLARGLRVAAERAAADAAAADAADAGARARERPPPYEGLHELVLQGAHLRDAALPELCAALGRHARLRVLSLDSTGLSADGAADVADALLGGVRGLRVLTLHANAIGPHGARALAHALEAQPSLRVLTLDSNAIGDAGAAALSRALGALGALTRLDLDDNEISDLGARALGASLAQQGSLQRLSISGNPLGEGGGSELVGALEQHLGLRALELDDTGLRDGGVRALCHALREHSQLEQLRLAGNGLGAAAGAELARGLGRFGEALRELDLSGNRLGDAAAAELAASLGRNCPRLESLALGYGNACADRAARALGAMLPHTRALHSLQLRHNDVRDASALEEARAHHPLPLSLDLLGNPLGEPPPQRPFAPGGSSASLTSALDAMMHSSPYHARAS